VARVCHLNRDLTIAGAVGISQPPQYISWVWTAMVAKAPVDSGPASPQFLSVNFGSLIAFVVFMSWGVALRGNPAVHKRIMILSTVAILDPGYGRLSGWLWPEPHSMLTWYFFNFWGDVPVLTAMARIPVAATRAEKSADAGICLCTPHPA
jgi:hypothetical protein